MKRALVLYSGGLDSTTVVYVVRSGGFDPVALIFRYGQRHEVEVERAVALAEHIRMPYRVQRLDLRALGGSALTADDVEVPRGRSEEEISGGGVPPTYVPARNTIFLAHALAWAEVENIDDIFLGINAVDYSGYPDCRPEYLEAFERLAGLACRRTTEEGVTLRFHAPLLRKTKADIIRWGKELGVDYSRTWSCYAPKDIGGSERLAAERLVACGECDSCRLRRKGFREADIEDPTTYWVSG
ncbi:MAG: 7-cyano-7-deazaguanine synthase QueC [Planctomycetota bacterium]|nr:7-cyano-7-deazaguanine synthase QueC [Planctomycetota bacterium]